MCSIVSLSSRRILHILSSSSIQYLFSLSSVPHLNLAIIFFSFALFFPRYNRTSSATHLSYSLLYLDSLILSLLSCLPVSLSFSLSFRSHSFHFLTGIPVPPAVLLSLLLIRVLFLSLSSTQSVSCTLPFRPLCPRTLPLSFPLSLSACSSCTFPSLCTLLFLCPLLAPISNISYIQTFSLCQPCRTPP
jgi:hypothetical protein